MSRSNCPPEALLADLRRQVEKLEVKRPPEDGPSISTGSPALDRLLPAGGLRRGTLVEYLSPAVGCGTGALALGAAREACRHGRALVVVEQTPARSTSGAKGGSRFYPPAAAAWGIDLSTIVVLRPVSQADALWALDQALRCPGVGAVWTACDRLDVRDFRRLQLAAEIGGTLGLLLRPARQRGQPTWADVQWLISPRSTVQSPRSKVKRLWTLDFGLWTVCVELVRCRGAAGGHKVLLELDESDRIWREVFDETTHSVPVFARLANSTTVRRA